MDATLSGTLPEPEQTASRFVPNKRQPECRWVSEIAEINAYPSLKERVRRGGSSALPAREMDTERAATGATTGRQKVPRRPEQPPEPAKCRSHSTIGETEGLFCFLGSAQRVLP
ncbi:hypothetical protein SKAU_G00399410 [Synaphobranchus kaupii]|uniref:Uncharacterized protein n=1 Tax=Synaphobranchus kaupii TaxID=118154 RepID=A0A9Q1E8R3_SYNKA|nr:hypothetical protein SKAU_G00399410 [Synaphobranchus kaupii]